ncbi:hypothetical protein CU097_010883 [Rhizopus azygosporus]|uniref:C2 domain-containing protein n=1 Tax=Rhizopus azygosporus TaxID=86630 RepID=A0A367KEX8_RHIAZ|nr:hypothetical protein CU097_010883 [Rhizopus azygosporus]
MAVGKLTVAPVTARGLAHIEGAKLFVGCFLHESEKHRTHSVDGPEPMWSNILTCNVSEGQKVLTVELVNESPNRGGLLAYGKVELDQVFNQGTASKWVALTSAANGQPFGELKLDLSFNGSNTVSSVTSSFGNMNLAGGQQVSYQQSTTQTNTSHHFGSESRQSSYSSLGPANPIPENYGAGNPPPFTPPAPVSYGTDSGGMPSPVGSGINTENMTKEEFEEAKARGKIPTWMKYGGGVLAGAAAIGLTAWGAHELKEHFDQKKEEEEKKHKHDQKPPVMPTMHQQPQNLPYKIDNHQYQAPPVEKYHGSDVKSEHKEKKKEKGEKKKKKKERRGSHSSSSSSSDSSSSDSDSDSSHKKKNKHKDSHWK